MPKFWNMSVRNDGVGIVTLYGEISDVTWWGDEITPKQFKEDLDGLGDVKDIDIHINSGGGDVFAGYTIYNLLKRHGAKKTVYVDGLAASIASLIAMAGDKVVMPTNSMIMIHNAWTAAVGNRDDLRKMADELEKVDTMLVNTFVSRTGLEADEIAQMMSNETWMTAEEAVEKGFADEIEESVKMAASLDKKFYDRYQHVPDTLTEEHTFDNSIVLTDATKAWTESGTTWSSVTIPAGYTTVVGTVTPATIDLNNRGESEPVEGINIPVEEQETAEPPVVEDSTALEEQRKDFNRIREKIMKGQNL